MKADYRLRFSGVVADATAEAFRAQVGVVIDAAIAAGLVVEADPIFFAQAPEAPVVVEEAPVKAPEAPVSKREWRRK